MNATDLQSLLDREGVPMEARAPKCDQYGDFWTHRGPNRIDDDLAELAHVGAMVKWLVAHDKEVRIWSPVDDIDVSSGVAVRTPIIWVVAFDAEDIDEALGHPTLTEALAHACGRIAKEKR